MTDKERAREIVRKVGLFTVITDDKYLELVEPALIQSIAQALAAVREECADIADQHASIEGIAQRIAKAIRSRGT